MTKKITALLVLTVLAAGFSNNAFAQSTRAIIQGPGQGQQKHGQFQQQGNTQRLLVDPGFQQPKPRLGFQGQMIYGYGMKVVSVNWGSAAKRAGLEAGDIISKINGRQIRSQWDYDQALQQAANYNYGNVQMKVRNVRYDWGYNVPKYAHVHTVLDGYGGSGPIGPQSQSGPIAARSRR